MKLPFRNNNPNKLREADDLGFGVKITGANERLLTPDGNFNVIRRGGQVRHLYLDLVEMRWSKFLLVVLAFYTGINILFAGLLLLAGVECFNGVTPGDWLHNFLQSYFFSVQTFTTVGYGAISPKCVSTNLMAAGIALSGLLSFCIVTGLLYARFSKPSSQIVFSRNAIIAPFRDGTALMFRIANRRSNKLINLEAKLTLSWVEDDRSQPGGKRRRFARLFLDLEKVVMLPLNWTLVHPITEDSPLFGKSGEDFKKMGVEVLALLEAFDETFSQVVHINRSYTAHEILCNVRFKPMYFPGEDGQTVLDLDLIDAVEG